VICRRCWWATGEVAKNSPGGDFGDAIYKIQLPNVARKWLNTYLPKRSCKCHLLNVPFLIKK